MYMYPDLSIYRSIYTYAWVYEILHVAQQRMRRFSYTVLQTAWKRPCTSCFCTCNMLLTYSFIRWKSMCSKSLITSLQSSSRPPVPEMRAPLEEAAVAPGGGLQQRIRLLRWRQRLRLLPLLLLLLRRRRNILWRQTNVVLISATQIDTSTAITPPAARDVGVLSTNIEPASRAWRSCNCLGCTHRSSGLLGKA